MDYRTSTKQALSLNALISTNIERSWLCQIQDCSGIDRLLVEQNGRSRQSLPGMNQGKAVDILFSIPSRGKDKHLKRKGRVVSIMDIGIKSRTDKKTCLIKKMPGEKHA